MNTLESRVEGHLGDIDRFMQDNSIRRKLFTNDLEMVRNGYFEILKVDQKAGEQQM